MKQVQIKVEGAAPLMLNNIIKANPLHPVTKAMKEYTKKRTKTEEDLAVLAKLEWLGALYWETPGSFAVVDGDLMLEGFGYPVINSSIIEAATIAGAKKYKQGPQFKAGVFCDENPQL